MLIQIILYRLNNHHYLSKVQCINGNVIWKHFWNYRRRNLPNKSCHFNLISRKFLFFNTVFLFHRCCTWTCLMPQPVHPTFCCHSSNHINNVASRCIVLSPNTWSIFNHYFGFFTIFLLSFLIFSLEIEASLSTQSIRFLSYSLDLDFVRLSYPFNSFIFPSITTFLRMLFSTPVYTFRRI